MIFDSSSMQNLRQKYIDEPNYRVPKIVLLDRFEGFADERRYLERILSEVRDSKQRDWIGRLVSDDHAQFMGAWFEMMLYGWLRQQGDVEVEPAINRACPDFVLTCGDTHPIIIEARAFLTQNEVRYRDMRNTEIRHTLDQIPRSYALHIKELQHGGSIDTSRLSEEVIEWLDTNADVPFSYQDESGNRIELEVAFPTSHDTIGTIGPTDSIWVDHDPLKRPLREKAKQHRSLRAAGHPYIIALFLESWQYSAEEIVSAWLGRTNVVVDIESSRVVDEKLDRTGIHFFGKEIRHRSVSGTIVFKAQSYFDHQRSFLQAWYIQNPYANVPIVDRLLNVEGRFVVVGRAKNSYQMKWLKRGSTE